MYSFIRQRVGGDSGGAKSITSNKNGKDTYVSHKCMYTKSLAQILSDRELSLGSFGKPPRSQNLYPPTTSRPRI